MGPESMGVMPHDVVEIDSVWDGPGRRTDDVPPVFLTLENNTEGDEAETQLALFSLQQESVRRINSKQEFGSTSGHEGQLQLYGVQEDLHRQYTTLAEWTSYVHGRLNEHGIQPDVEARQKDLSTAPIGWLIDLQFVSPTATPSDNEIPTIIAAKLLGTDGKLYTTQKLIREDDRCLAEDKGGLYALYFRDRVKPIKVYSPDDVSLASESYPEELVQNCKGGPFRPERLIAMYADFQSALQEFAIDNLLHEDPRAVRKDRMYQVLIDMVTQRKLHF